MNHNQFNRIMVAIREVIASHLPVNGKAILFGSQARGEANVDSDWDILIIVDKKKLQPSDYDTITYPLTELGWNMGEMINPIMYTKDEWESYKFTPFYKNVMTDGVML